MLYCLFYWGADVPTCGYARRICYCARLLVPFIFIVFETGGMFVCGVWLVNCFAEIDRGRDVCFGDLYLILV